MCVYRDVLLITVLLKRLPLRNVCFSFAMTMCVPTALASAGLPLTGMYFYIPPCRLPYVDPQGFCGTYFCVPPCRLL